MLYKLRRLETYMTSELPMQDMMKLAY